MCKEDELFGAAAVSIDVGDELQPGRQDVTEAAVGDFDAGLFGGGQDNPGRCKGSGCAQAQVMDCG
jgi:hypothetical protein